MAKLIVQVMDAADLMPKDGQGSANPFVEVDFDGQRHRTQTKTRDLFPAWNETLVFNVQDPRSLPLSTIEVSVYNDRKPSNQRNFLGRVRISGAMVPLSESEASVQRYPLDKRGLFSNIRGDIALKIHLAHGQFFSDQPPPPPQQQQEPQQQQQQQHVPIIEEIKTGKFDFKNEFNEYEEVNENIQKNKDRQKEVRTFFSVGRGGGGGGPGPAPAPAAPPPVAVETKANFMKAGPAPANMMHMQFPGQKPPANFGLVETRPPVAARMGYRGADKTATTYDLVERMHFLYVNVVKARDLPAMDITGSCDPYVEVKLGNYKGVTKHHEKNQNPVWNQVFAFSKERLQSTRAGPKDSSAHYKLKKKAL